MRQAWIALAAGLAALGWSCGNNNGVSSGPDALVLAKVYAGDSLSYADTTRLDNGLTYLRIADGGDERPGRGSLVSVHYTGRLIDMQIFDSSYSRGSPFSFALGQGRVIDGWDEGIALMTEGERGLLVIPSDLGYGPRGSEPIPPNATLLFDVWLVNVE
jgi:FKBP-type peptidyl-prolyl cis-trans isomerase